MKTLFASLLSALVSFTLTAAALDSSEEIVARGASPFAAEIGTHGSTLRGVVLEETVIIGVSPRTTAKLEVAEVVQGGSYRCGPPRDLLQGSGQVRTCEVSQ